MAMITEQIGKRVQNPVDVDVGLNKESAVAGTGSALDQLRGSLFELPLLVVIVGYAYHRAFVYRDPDRSFGLGDLVGVTIIAYALKYVGVSGRWGGL